MDRTTRIVVSLGAVALVAVLVLAAPALAEAQQVVDQGGGGGGGGGGSDPGTKIGDLIRSIASGIVFSLGGLTALAAFLRRDVGIAFTALVITAILGLFVTPAGETALREFTGLLAGVF